MKKHHDHSRFYQGKHLIGTGLQLQRFSPLSSWRETWCHIDMVPVKELAVPHLDPPAAQGDCEPQCIDGSQETCGQAFRHMGSHSYSNHHKWLLKKKKNVSEVTAINEAFIWSMVFDASIIAHFFSIAQVSSYLTGKCPVLRTQEMAQQVEMSAGS